MSEGRLPASIEASSLLRRAEAAGGFGTIIARGDAASGSLIVLVACRGVHRACLERQLTPAGYAWRETGPADGSSSADVDSWSRKRRSFDPDCWLIELDIPSTERFIAETISIG